MQREESVAASPRTHGLRHLAVVRVRTGWRHHRPLGGVLLTLPATAVAAAGADPSTNVNPHHGQVERLLQPTVNWDFRPFSVINRTELDIRKPSLNAAALRLVACRWRSARARGLASLLRAPVIANDIVDCGENYL